MKELYTYHGNVSSLSREKFILKDLSDDSKPPCELSAPPALMKYIWDLSGTDEEEKYMNADYCYDSNLQLHLISIPVGEKYREEAQEKGIGIIPPAKVITTDPTFRELLVFGQADYLKSDNPKPMSIDEHTEYLKWMAESNYRILPDSMIAAEEKGMNKAISEISYRMFYIGKEIGEVAKFTGISVDAAKNLCMEFTKNKDKIIRDLKLGHGNQR